MVQGSTSTARRSTLWTSLSTSPSSTSSSDTSYELPHACKAILPGFAAAWLNAVHLCQVPFRSWACQKTCSMFCCYLNEKGQERRKCMCAVLLVVMHPALHQKMLTSR
jgi:hypothetical protein